MDTNIFGLHICLDDNPSKSLQEKLIYDKSSMMMIRLGVTHPVQRIKSKSSPRTFLMNSVADLQYYWKTLTPPKLF